MSLPLNRVIAFAGPYISVIAAGVAAWLVAKANVAGIKGLDQANVATQVSGGLTFTLVAVLTWLGQSKWLTGHHLSMAGDAEVQAAALATHTATPVEAPDDPQHEALIALGEDLPDDEVEFANQPEGLEPVTPAPSQPAEDLPDDEEELTTPPDQDARAVPDDAGDADDDAEEDVTLADDEIHDVVDDDEIHVAPQVPT